MQYKKTIVQKLPKFLNKKLLLINKNRDGLFRNKEKSFFMLEIDKKGELVVNEIKKNMETCELKESLRGLGRKYLNLDDPSVPTMLKYCVLPEMEVERIFNNIRYKYLKAVYGSKNECPAEMMKKMMENPEWIEFYNRAFLSMAGFTVYQGSTKNRRDNDSFWKEAGFSHEFTEKDYWEKEKEELKDIIRIIKTIHSGKNVSKIYAELIAIKPGFHECWIHEDYFCHRGKRQSAKSPREKVLLHLKGKCKLPKLNKYPDNINWNHYYRFASCNITQGPFVFRKSIDIEYVEKLREIKCQEDLGKIEQWFSVLDYYNANLDSRKKLKDFLEKKAKTLCGYFMNN